MKIEILWLSCTMECKKTTHTLQVRVKLSFSGTCIETYTGMHSKIQISHLITVGK